MLTTFYSYGNVAAQRQGEIIKGLSQTRLAVPTDAATAEAMQKLLRKLQNPEVLRVLATTVEGDGKTGNL